MTGQFIGTIDYVAPEQVEAKPVDGRTDIYSLGCVFYQCLTGSVPYDREGDVAVVWAHLREPPPRVTERRSDLPAQIDDVVAKAMAKSPDERFQTCREFMNVARAAFKPIATEPSPTAAPVKETVVSPQPGLQERDPQKVASAGAAAAGPTPNSTRKASCCRMTVLLLGQRCETGASARTAETPDSSATRSGGLREHCARPRSCIGRGRSCSRQSASQ